jgi:hypothetical protein
VATGGLDNGTVIVGPSTDPCNGTLVTGRPGPSAAGPGFKQLQWQLEVRPGPAVCGSESGAAAAPAGAAAPSHPGDSEVESVRHGGCQSQYWRTESVSENLKGFRSTGLGRTRTDSGRP